MWIVRLKPRGSLTSELRSDTLFGAIAWATSALWGEDVLLGWLERFARRDPPFLLSSAAPYSEQSDGHIQYYMPRPWSWPRQKPARNLAEYRLSKRVKKVRWIPREWFLRIAAGEELEPLTMAGQAPRAPGFETRAVMHNVIDRVRWSTGGPGSAGNVFYLEERFASRGSGLYFLVDLRDSSVAPVLKGTLALLEHVGLGGNVSRGRGHFTFSVEDASPDFLPRVQDPTHFVTLSLYYPRAEEREMFASHSQSCAYQLAWRRGKVGGRFYATGHPWKRAVNYFIEGSVLPWRKEQPIGENPLVKQLENGRMRIQSYGFSFAVPMRWEA